MRYGLMLDPMKAIMVAADDLIEFENLFSSFMNFPPPGLLRAERATVEELFTIPIFSKFRIPPMVLEFTSDKQIDDFCVDYRMVIMDDVAFCIEKHREMVEEMRAAKPVEDDDRPLREILGITAENDQWDDRSDKAKARDQKFGEYRDKMIKQSSFGGPPKGPVTATEGDPVDFDPDTAPDTDDRLMAKKSALTTYQLVDVTGAKLPEVMAALRAANETPEKTFKRRNSPTGCWISIVATRTAARYNDILVAAGFDSKTYAVDDKGEVIKAKKPKRVKSAGPRPWNKKAKALLSMSEADRDKNLETYDGKEFYFVIEDRGRRDGIKITIVPKVVFDATNDLWPEPLGIASLLPYDFDEEAPGVYTSGRDQIEYVKADMHRRGFTENMLLQMALNVKSVFKVD